MLFPNFRQLLFVGKSSVKSRTEGNSAFDGSYCMIKKLMKNLLRTVALLLAFCITAAAAEQAEPLVIRADRVLDVKNGKLIPDAVVVVQEDKILSISPKELPKNAKVIELKGMTLLPGLIDTHTHLTYDADNYWLDIGRQPHSYSAAYAMVGAKNAKITLMAGFTTVRDLGACCFADIDVMKAIEKNLIDGPDIVPAGHIIATTGSACDQSRADPTITQPGPEDGIGDDIESLVKAVRTQIKYGAKVIKVCADHNAFSEEELKAIADTAHRRKIKLAAHIWDEDSIRKSIAAGADSIEHCGIMSDKTVDEMVQKGVYLVPTMYTLDEWDLSQMKPELRAEIEKDVSEFEESFRRSLRKGVKMAFGSDSGQIPHGDNAKEFTSLVKRGMPPIQAIQSATTNAADLLSLKDRGEIKEGLRADLIAVAGNPLEKISELEKPLFIMKAGKIYKQP